MTDSMTDARLRAAADGVSSADPRGGAAAHGAVSFPDRRRVAEAAARSAAAAEPDAETVDGQEPSAPPPHAPPRPARRARR